MRQITKRSLKLFLLIAAGIVCCALPFRASAAAVEEIRMLYPNEWGVDHVTGLAYAQDFDYLYLVDYAETVAGRTTIVTITPHESFVQAIEIDFALADAINIMFDDIGRRLLLFDSDHQRLAQLSVDSNGLLEPTTLTVTSIADLAGVHASGLAMDRTGTNLYVLDGTARQLHIVPLNIGGSPSQEATTVLDLRRYRGDLRGIAVHPHSNTIFIGNNRLQEMYELTPTGKLLDTFELSLFALTDMGGMTFVPSADRTDAPGTLHLIISDSKLPVPTVNATALPPTNKLYLPLLSGTPLAETSALAAAPTLAAMSPDESLLFGELREIALCGARCSAQAKNVSFQVAASEDDA